MNAARLGRRMAVAVSTVLAAATLSACGADNAKDTAPAAGDMAGMTTSAPATAGFNDADVAFAQMMIPDHTMVADMAALAEKKAASKDLKTLAARMSKDNTAQADTLRGWLTTWGKPASGDMAGMTMPGAMTAKDMDMLESMSGMRFDMMFAQMMVKHHQATMQMARDETSKGSSSDAKTMATNMISTLTAQSKQLQALTKM